MNSSPPNACDPGARIFKLMQDNAEALTGVRDAGHLTGRHRRTTVAHARRPGALLRPDAHNIGAPDEYVDVDELAQSSRRTR